MPPKISSSSNPNHIFDLRIPPENWFICISQNIHPGRPYYFNVVTNQRQWNFPEDNISQTVLVPEMSVANSNQVTEPVIGFIVFFDRIAEMMGGAVPPIKIPYLNIEIERVLARSVDEYYFTDVPKLEHLHKLWRSSDNYVRLLRRYYQKDTRRGRFCELHNDTFNACRIEDTLFITEKVEEASALLIQGNWKRGNIVMDIDGIMSQNTPKPSRIISEFLIDPVPKSYTFLNDEDSLIDIESIEFTKRINPNSVFFITARIMHSTESAMREIERSLRNSKNPFTDSIAMYYQNNCYKTGAKYSNPADHIEDFKKLCEDEPYTTEQGGTILCWIELLVLSDVITYEDYLELNKDIEKDRALHTEHDIIVKYIMIVLKKVLPNGNQHFREELAKVKCIRKQKFVYTDLHLPLF
jgi:hypothetical protein